MTVLLPICEQGTIRFCTPLNPITDVIVRAVKPSGAAFEFDATTFASGDLILNWPTDVPDPEWFTGDVLWFVLDGSDFSELVLAPDCTGGETAYAIRTQSIAGDSTNPPFTIGCQCP